MYKILGIGDLHVKRSNLKHTYPLFDRIISLSKEHDVTVHYGDIYNDHGVLTADVQKAVADFFQSVSNSGYFFNIEGNHDQDSDGINSSLYVHSLQSIRIVDRPIVVNLKDNEPVLMVPFIRSSAEFELKVSELIKMNPKVKLVFCHQEFNGAQFENGFYAPGGVDSTKFPGVQFISGHIHEQSKFSNVWYIGAPRWLTKSDANKDRGLWSITVNDGVVVDAKFISSEDICPAYRSVTLTPEDVLSENMPNFKFDDKVFVEYSGDEQSDIKKIQKKYPNLSLKHKPKKIVSHTEISESNGVVLSIDNYLNSLDLKINKDLVKEEIKLRMGMI